MRKWMAVVAASVGLWAASTSQAQITTTNYATSEFEPWTFAPIVSGGAIRGFLCWADPMALTGDNIPIIWYHRDPYGQWATAGWADYDLGVAVKYIREAYDDDTIFEIDPTLSIAITENTPYNQPKELVNGLFEDDPAHYLLETAEDPESVMVTLVHIGWKAAPELSVLAVDSDVPECEDAPATDAKAVDLLLDQMLNTMEFAIFGEVLTDVDCYQTECTGCVTHYAPPEKKPNSGWIYRYHGVHPITGQKLCYYDYPATQRWWRSGKDKNCNPCTGSGVDNVYIRAMRVVAPGAPCEPPEFNP
jgi:hypothetical protein